MRWAKHVAYMGDRRGAYRVLVGNLRERGPLEDLDVDGITLKLIFKNLDGAWTGLVRHRIRTGDALL
jgi:hypothetical protein